MKIDIPVQYANACKTSKSAAVAAAAIETEISLGERPEDWYTQAEDALALLRDRHPGFWKLDAYMAPPSMSPEAHQALAPKEDQPKAKPPAGKGRPVALAQRKDRPSRFSLHGIVVAGLVTICFVSLLVHVVSSSAPAKAAVSHAQPLSAAWTDFHGLCTQDASPAGCRCWEQHLNAQGIGANDALLILNQATANLPSEENGGSFDDVKANLEGQPAGWAMKGCL